MTKEDSVSDCCNRRIETMESSLVALLSGANEAQQTPWEVRCFDVVGSTMDKARELLPLLKKGQPAVVLSKSQFNGRGTHGRRWTEASGALYSTFIFSQRGKFLDLSGFTLMTGCVISAALKEVLGEEGLTGLKWPNDIITRENRKLGGVLVEAVSEGEQHFILTGIGINISSKPEALDTAACLNELAGTPIISPAALAAKVGVRFLNAWNIFLKSGFSAFKAEWEKYAFILNQPAKLSSSSGDFAGVIQGVDDTGALLVKATDGLRRVVSGRIDSFGE